MPPNGCSMAASALQVMPGSQVRGVDGAAAQASLQASFSHGPTGGPQRKARHDDG
jgi:hypothetical protein